MWRVLLLGAVLLQCLGSSQGQYGSQHFGRYFGTFIGRFNNRHHNVTGDIYVVDSRTVHIRDFSYDGAGPDAFFWGSATRQPNSEGFIIPDERGTKEVLGPYRNRDITLTLPEGKTLRDLGSLSVWCRAYKVNFGELPLPDQFDYPAPQRLESLLGEHGVSSGEIVVVDAQTFLIPDFSYDGKAPDAHFWVGKGKPGPDGIRVPDESGSDAPLKRYNRKTMVLTLPGDLTVFDIDHIGVWCRLYFVDFGHVRIPRGLNVPPSLRMLGVAPQRSHNGGAINYQTTRHEPNPPQQFNNNNQVYNPYADQNQVYFNQNQNQFNDQFASVNNAIFPPPTTYRPHIQFQQNHHQIQQHPVFQVQPVQQVQPTQHFAFQQHHHQQPFHFQQPHQNQFHHQHQASARHDVVIPHHHHNHHNNYNNNFNNNQHDSDRRFYQPLETLQGSSSSAVGYRPSRLESAFHEGQGVPQGSTGFSSFSFRLGDSAHNTYTTFH